MQRPRTVTLLGNLSLGLTLLLALWSIALAGTGATRHQALFVSSRRAVLVLPSLLSIAVLSLVTAFLRRDFNVGLVAAHSTRNLGSIFTAFAANAAWSGSLLLSVWAFSLIAAPLALGSQRGRVSSAAVPMIAGIVILILGVLVVTGNPFARLGVTPMEGKGLDPALQDAGFLFTAPLRVLGFALIGRTLLAVVLDALAGWTGVSRSVERWLVTTWLTLTLILSLDVWHAYGTANPAGAWSWPPSHPVTGALWVLVSVAWCASRLRGRREGGSRMFSVAGTGITAGLVAVAIAAFFLHGGPVREIRLRSGASATVPSRFGKPYLVTNMGISRFEASDRYVTAATLDVERDERPIGLVTSERRQYFDVLGRPLGDPVTRVGLRRGLLEDLRVVLREPTGEQAVYVVQVTPLASLLWLAVALLLGGGLARLYELAD